MVTLVGGPGPTVPLKKWQIFWPETSGPTKMVPDTFHQPRRVKNQPASTACTARGWASPPVHQHLMEAPAPSHPCLRPRLPHLDWHGLGVLATQTSCELRTADLLVRVWELLGVVTLRPPPPWRGPLRPLQGWTVRPLPELRWEGIRASPLKAFIWRRTERKRRPSLGQWGCRGQGAGPRAPSLAHFQDLLFQERECLAEKSTCE